MVANANFSNEPPHCQKNSRTTSPLPSGYTIRSCLRNTLLCPVPYLLSGISGTRPCYSVNTVKSSLIGLSESEQEAKTVVKRNALLSSSHRFLFFFIIEFLFALLFFYQKNPMIPLFPSRVHTLGKQLVYILLHHTAKIVIFREILSTAHSDLCFLITNFILLSPIQAKMQHQFFPKLYLLTRMLRQYNIYIRYDQTWREWEDTNYWTKGDCPTIYIFDSVLLCLYLSASFHLFENNIA